MIQQLVEDLRLLERHGLDHGVVLAALAFNDVGRERPRGTDEAENSCFIADALTETAQHLTHKGHRLGWIEGTQGIDLSHAADRIADLRALAFDDVEINAHPRKRSEDVREQDHAVRLEGVEGLHRDLIGEIRVLGAFAEAGVLVAKIPVDLHVTTGLTHHPHGWTLH